MAPRHKFKDVDEYISTFPKETQEILEKIRKIIKKNAPKATEMISYNIPGFKQDGYLIYFAAFKSHISLYPASDEMIKEMPELEKHRVSKGTLQFKLEDPIPYDLIKDVVEYKVREKENKINKA